MRLTRRALLQTGATALSLPAAGVLGGALRPALAQEPERVWKHGLSLFGNLKYPAGFKSFDYVNVDAPKGGTARLIAFGTFDNFNMVVAGVKGSLASGVNQLYDSLMVPSMDDVAVGYGPLLEEIVEFMRTRVPPVSNAETLEMFRFMDAAQRSRAGGGVPVSVGR